MYRTTALLVLASLLGANLVAAEERVPLPPAPEIEQATKLVRNLFKDDYAKTAPKAKLALAEKLFKQADETKDDLAAQFVLYRETADLAAAAGDVTLALRALDAMQTRFAGIKAEQPESVLKALSTKVSAADALPLATHLLKSVDEAVTADELDSAERLAKLAETTAIKSKNVRVASAAAARVKEVEAFKKEAETVKTALKTLELNPTDPAASTVAGRYFCFQKGNWEKGLPLLAAGDDAKLKDVARKDAANPREPADLLAVADAWYDLGKAATAVHQRRAMLARSFAFYNRAVPDLNGLTRTKAEKKVEELEKVVDAHPAADDIWGAVRAAVRAKDVEEIAPQGGVFGAKDYRESAPEGGVLIGFHYGTGKARNSNDVMVVYLQPIYLTAGGEKLGTAYGKAPAKPQTAKAKTGYAVGSIKVWGGAQLEGCSLTFMKVQGKGLNAADKYDSPLMGRDTAPGNRVLGDGRPVVGLFGKVLDGDPDICTIGLVVAGAKAKK